MKLPKLIRILITSCLFSSIAHCPAFSQKNTKKDFAFDNQFKELSIGDNVPASAWNKIPKKKTTKLIILDFWSTGCTSCIEAFPHMEELQREFSEKLDIVLVNPWENEKQVEERMNKMKMYNDKNILKTPSLPFSFSRITGDTTFKQLFPAGIIPHHVWLDAKGKVLYITHGYNATSNHVRRILNGESIRMSLKRDLDIDGFDACEGILRKGHNSVKPAFYSGFTRYSSGYGGGGASRRIDSVAGTVMRIYINEDIASLYQSAFGKTLRPILEVNNKQDYIEPRWILDGDVTDEWNEKNLFTYEICVPVSEEKHMNKYMQADLNRFFGMEKGIEGLVGKRKFKALVLVKTDDTKLPFTKGGERNHKNKPGFFVLNNYPMSMFIEFMRSNLEDMELNRPFLDESGFDPKLKVDVELTGDLKDLKNVKKQLKPYGLDIVESEHDVEVLILKDK